MSRSRRAEIVQGLPRELDRILTRCLRKDPNRRYQHAGDLKIDLQQVTGRARARGHRDPARRRRAKALVVACGRRRVRGGPFAVGWWLHRPPAEPPPGS